MVVKTLIKTKLIDPTHIEVREYELGKDLKLIHCVGIDYKKCSHIGEEYMVLTVANQKKGKVLNTQQSKFPPYSYYRIYKFLWKPKGVIEVQQVQDKQIVWGKNSAKIV